MGSIPFNGYDFQFINHVATVEGEGVSQITTLLHKPYLVKVSKKGSQKTQTSDNVVYGLTLSLTEDFIDFHWFCTYMNPI